MLLKVTSNDISDLLIHPQTIILSLSFAELSTIKVYKLLFLIRKLPKFRIKYIWLLATLPQSVLRGQRFAF